MEENEEITRITILGAIIAILFGILEYIPREEKYDLFLVEGTLKVISQSYFAILILPTLVYILLMGLRRIKGADNRKLDKISERVYSSIIILSLFIFFLTTGLVIILTLARILPTQVTLIIFLSFLFFQL